MIPVSYTHLDVYKRQEETGLVSVARGGQLTRGVKREELREKLSQIQYRNSESRKFTIWKGWRRRR